MNIMLSDKQLKDIFNLNEMQNIFKYFSTLTGIDVSLYDINGAEVISYRIHNDNCICELLKNKPYNKVCEKNIIYASKKAAELGEPYIFNCCCAVKCAAPIVFEEKLIGSLVCGPVLLWEADELAKEEVQKFVDNKLDNYDIDGVFDCLKQLDCQNMTSAAEFLFIIVNYLSKEESKYLSQSKEISLQQKQIAELLIEKKKTSLNKSTERKTLSKYSSEMEKELIAYVQTGDKLNGKRILNDMLGEIFLMTSGNLDIIKAKLYELTAILMRAAVDTGASLEKMSEYILYYNKILAQNTTFEDLCYMTSEIMEAFMAVVYQNRMVSKTSKHLESAIEYIKKNYNKQLSLKTVADEIFLNSYYLSHLFREQLSTTFSDYLNEIRMGECERLFKSTQMNVGEIALSIGFKDANYFTKAFKKHFGITPKKYMAIHR